MRFGANEGISRGVSFRSRESSLPPRIGKNLLPHSFEDTLGRRHGMEQRARSSRLPNRDIYPDGCKLEAKGYTAMKSSVFPPATGCYKLGSEAPARVPRRRSSEEVQRALLGELGCKYFKMGSISRLDRGMHHESG